MKVDNKQFRNQIWNENNVSTGIFRKTHREKKKSFCQECDVLMRKGPRLDAKGEEELIPTIYHHLIVPIFSYFFLNQSRSLIRSVIAYSRLANDVENMLVDSEECIANE
jgi:hypothetical protein